MSERIERHGLQVGRSLFEMIEQEALSGTGIEPDRFWKGLSGLVHGKGPKNRALRSGPSRRESATTLSERGRASRPSARAWSSTEPPAVTRSTPAPASASARQVWRVWISRARRPVHSSG